MGENKMLWAGLFITGAALTWGVYVPTIHKASTLLGTSLRAFLLVGLAYFLVAVVIPAVFIFILGDPTLKQGVDPSFSPSAKAVAWGLAAGTFGAVGALCVIFANTYGSPLYVAPLVFAGAPIVNTIVTITIFSPASKLPDWRFFLGLVLAALGAALVMLYKPATAPHGPAKSPGAPAHASAASPWVDRPDSSAS